MWQLLSVFAFISIFSSPAWSAKRTLDSSFLRTDILVSPESKTKTPRPLVVLLHGCKMDADDILNISEIEKYVDERNFSVLAPGQSRMNNLDNCWNFFDPSNQTSVKKGAGVELANLSALIRKTIEESDGAIDPEQIYIGGISSGAAMALNLFLCDTLNYRGLAMHSGIAFRVSDFSNVEKLLTEGSSLPKAQLTKKLKHCPKNIDQSKIIAVHGDKDERVDVANFLDLKEQLTRQCSAKLSPDTRRRFALIKGLAHKWSGSHFKSVYAEPKTVAFTPMFLRHFGIIK